MQPMQTESPYRSSANRRYPPKKRHEKGYLHFRLEIARISPQPLNTTHNFIMHTREEKLKAFGRFLDVLDQLREKCPWDRKQTNHTLRTNTIEETYELADALINDDTPNICKELGDVLLHICFYAKIAQEKEQFDIADVCQQLTDKLIYRHPHVYHPSQVGAPDPKPLPYGTDTHADSSASSAATTTQVLQNWEQLKLKEKGGNKRVLAGVPQALPSLIKAYRLQEKASNVGFDWEKADDVWDKVHEELDELRAEISKTDRKGIEAEMGDFIFSIVNAARLYHVNPDDALELTNKKFTRRFNYIEEQTLSHERQLKDLSLQEMDSLWNEAKQKEQQQ